MRWDYTESYPEQVLPFYCILISKETIGEGKKKTKTRDLPLFTRRTVVSTNVVSLSVYKHNIKGPTVVGNWIVHSYKVVPVPNSHEHSIEPKAATVVRQPLKVGVVLIW